MLKIKNLSYQDNHQKDIFHDLSFEFPAQGLVIITGNRTDQEILFNLLTYQKKPSSGFLWVGEKNSQAFTNSDIAFCYNFIFGIFSSQEFFLIDDLDVKSNIEMYLEIQNKTFNTKKTKEVFQAVGLMEEIELDSLIKELNNEQKQKLILAILMLKDCRVIVAFEPGKTSDIHTQKNFLAHFKKLSQTKLVIIFTSSDIDEINVCADQKLIIAKNSFKRREKINFNNQKLNQYFNFEAAKQLYLQPPHVPSDKLTELLSFFAFDFRPLPFKLHFLATLSLLRFHVPIISCFYTMLLAMVTFLNIYYHHTTYNFLVLLLSLLILLVLIPLTFLFFSFWYRLEIKHMSVLNKKTFCYLQKIGINKSIFTKIFQFQIETYRNLELELTIETALNTFLSMFLIYVLYQAIQHYWDDIHPILILAPFTLLSLATPFIVIPLMIKHIVKKRVKNEVDQKYYNYL